MKVNVLVYSGPGTTVESVKHCLNTFRRLLSPYYAVIPINEHVIVNEPWGATCALLCIPGGADRAFCRTLNGTGNKKITQYIRRGGNYIGFCAGAYFASAAVEFEKGNIALEVTGRRELGFFPGVCQGPVFKGFQYDSEAGARACVLDVTDTLVEAGAPVQFCCYYNGGGAFIGAETFAEHGIEILARYHEGADLDQEINKVAAIKCKVGEGYAVLIGTHPEFAISGMKRVSDSETYSEVIRILEDNEALRVSFMISCLKVLGLKTNKVAAEIPSLSSLHLSCLRSDDIQLFLKGLTELVGFNDKEDGYGIIRGENDVFLLEDQDTPPKEYENSGASYLETYLNDTKPEKPVFHLRIHWKRHPTSKETPHFSTSAYFGYLHRLRTEVTSTMLQFGSPLLYGEVVTSTNTILDKNFKLLQKLPSGFTAVATLQTAGRGRGSNVWLSPMGALTFSIVVRHNIRNTAISPVIFIQYLAALAIVKAIKEYDVGYKEVPVRLKWPNDIYVQNVVGVESPSYNEPRDFVKIGGILVNSSFAEEEFLLVIGCGINTTNEAPTTSLNQVIKTINKGRAAKGQVPLLPYEQEKLLAKTLVIFETYYEKFTRLGFHPFEEEYYKWWLHSRQTVILETAGGVKAQIRGISMDDGMLVADELDEWNNRNGRTYELQTDNNSFDFFNGLLKRKE